MGPESRRSTVFAALVLICISLLTVTAQFVPTQKQQQGHEIVFTVPFSHGNESTFPSLISTNDESENDPRKSTHFYCEKFLDCETEMLRAHKRCTERSRHATGDACHLNQQFIDLTTLMEVRLEEFKQCVSAESEAHMDIDGVDVDISTPSSPMTPNCTQATVNATEQLLAASDPMVGCWRSIGLIKQQCHSLQKCCPSVMSCADQLRTSETTLALRKKHKEINQKTLACRSQLRQQMITAVERRRHPGNGAGNSTRNALASSAKVHSISILASAKRRSDGRLRKNKKILASKTRPAPQRHLPNATPTNKQILPQRTRLRSKLTASAFLNNTVIAGVRQKDTVANNAIRHRRVPFVPDYFPSDEELLTSFIQEDNDLMAHETSTASTSTPKTKNPSDEDFLMSFIQEDNDIIRTESTTSSTTTTTTQKPRKDRGQPRLVHRNIFAKKRIVQGDIFAKKPLVEGEAFVQRRIVEGQAFGQKTLAEPPNFVVDGSTSEDATTTTGVPQKDVTIKLGRHSKEVILKLGIPPKRSRGKSAPKLGQKKTKKIVTFSRPERVFPKKNIPVNFAQGFKVPRRNRLHGVQNNDIETQKSEKPSMGDQLRKFEQLLKSIDEGSQKSSPPRKANGRSKLHAGQSKRREDSTRVQLLRPGSQQKKQYDRKVPVAHFAELVPLQAPKSMEIKMKTRESMQVVDREVPLPPTPPQSSKDKKKTKSIQFPIQSQTVPPFVSNAPKENRVSVPAVDRKVPLPTPKSLGNSAVRSLAAPPFVPNSSTSREKSIHPPAAVPPPAEISQLTNSNTKAKKFASKSKTIDSSVSVPLLEVPKHSEVPNRLDVQKPFNLSKKSGKVNAAKFDGKGERRSLSTVFSGDGGALRSTPAEFAGDSARAVLDAILRRQRPEKVHTAVYRGDRKDSEEKTTINELTLDGKTRNRKKVRKPSMSQYLADHRPFGIFATNRRDWARDQRARRMPLIQRRQPQAFALPPAMNLRKLRLFAARPHLLKSTATSLDVKSNEHILKKSPKSAASARAKAFGLKNFWWGVLNKMRGNGTTRNIHSGSAAKNDTTENNISIINTTTTPKNAVHIEEKEYRKSPRVWPRLGQKKSRFQKYTRKSTSSKSSTLLTTPTSTRTPTSRRTTTPLTTTSTSTMSTPTTLAGPYLFESSLEATTRKFSSVFNEILQRKNAKNSAKFVPDQQNSVVRVIEQMNNEILHHKKVAKAMAFAPNLDRQSNAVVNEIEMMNLEVDLMAEKMEEMDRKAHEIAQKATPESKKGNGSARLVDGDIKKKKTVAFGAKTSKNKVNEIPRQIVAEGNVVAKKVVSNKKVGKSKSEVPLGQIAFSKQLAQPKVAFGQDLHRKQFLWPNIAQLLKEKAATSITPTEGTKQQVTPIQKSTNIRMDSSSSNEQIQSETNSSLMIRTKDVEASKGPRNYINGDIFTATPLKAAGKMIRVDNEVTENEEEVGLTGTSKSIWPFAVEDDMLLVKQTQPTTTTTSQPQFSSQEDLSKDFGNFIAATIANPLRQEYTKHPVAATQATPQRNIIVNTRATTRISLLKDRKFGAMTVATTQSPKHGSSEEYDGPIDGDTKDEKEPAQLSQDIDDIVTATIATPPRQFGKVSHHVATTRPTLMPRRSFVATTVAVTLLPLIKNTNSVATTPSQLRDRDVHVGGTKNKMKSGEMNWAQRKKTIQFPFTELRRQETAHTGLVKQKGAEKQIQTPPTINNKEAHDDNKMPQNSIKDDERLSSSISELDKISQQIESSIDHANFDEIKLQLKDRENFDEIKQKLKARKTINTKVLWPNKNWAEDFGVPDDDEEENTHETTTLTTTIATKVSSAGKKFGNGKQILTSNFEQKQLQRMFAAARQNKGSRIRVKEIRRVKDIRRARSPQKLAKRVLADEQRELDLARKSLIRNLEKFLNSKKGELEKKLEERIEASRVSALRKTKEEYNSKQQKTGYCELYSTCMDQLRHIRKHHCPRLSSLEGLLVPGLPGRRFGPCLAKLQPQYQKADNVREELDKGLEDCLIEKIAAGTAFAVESCPAEWPTLPTFEAEFDCLLKVSIVQNHCKKLGHCCGALEKCRETVENTNLTRRHQIEEERLTQQASECQVENFEVYRALRLLQQNQDIVDLPQKQAHELLSPSTTQKQGEEMFPTPPPIYELDAELGSTPAKGEQSHGQLITELGNNKTPNRMRLL